MANLKMMSFLEYLVCYLNLFSYRIAVIQNGVFYFTLSVFLSPFPHKTSFMCETQPQGSSVLTILPDYSLCKMANFATFQKRVIFPILCFIVFERFFA